MEYRAYKFRLYPNKEQEERIIRIFGSCRYVYNHFLGELKKQYETTGYIHVNIPSRNLEELRAKVPWLKETNQNCQENAISDMKVAVRKFLSLKKRGSDSKFPRFRAKRGKHQSYKSINQRNSVEIIDGAVKLPMLGPVKCRISKTVKGDILSATVSRNGSGKYFVSLLCKSVPLPHLPTTGAAIGIDVGLKTYAVTSDGVEYHNPQFLERSERKLKRLKRQLSRKPKGSKRRNKVRVRYAKQWEHVHNQRDDFLNKLTTQLIRENDIICVEDLNIQSMVKDSQRAQAISDVSWGKFRRQLQYKAEWYGKKVVPVSRYFPSSQLCSNCGAKWPGAKNLSVREWTCPECGTVHDRDINAAKNILKEGLRQLA